MELIRVLENGLYLIRTEHAACVVDKKTYGILKRQERMEVAA